VATALFVLLPVPGYHYPVALLPVALAAWTRSRGSAASSGVNLRLAAAFVVADLSIALPVVQWLAVGLVLTAVRASRPRP
jgi:hypothetical protein